MGRVGNLVVLKLGGSLITFKDKPLAVNYANIRITVRAIAAALPLLEDARLFILHGGGSFGHYYAKKYGLSTRLQITDPKHVSVITGAMMDLHSIVLKEMLKAKVPCMTILPSQILTESGAALSSGGEKYLEALFDSGLVPITFGNVHVSKKGSRIVSGDRLALAVVKSFGKQNSRVVFGMDVDGIFPDEKMEGAIIDELSERSDVRSELRHFDVTGGISSKIQTGLELSRCGADVFFVNGSKPARLKAALEGRRNVKGTKIYSHKEGF